VHTIVQHPGETARAPLSLKIVSGADGEGRIHQDAGDGYGYRLSAWRTTTVKQQGGAIRFKHVGDFQAARAVSSVEILGINDKPKEIRIDGRVASGVSYEQDERRLRLPLPVGGVSEIVFVP
jgi:hypothetical protein